ncbi:hypothetical protein OAF42_02005 [Planctomicrobium sp.]|nr:hypothetical protein [Planctomicrobium sp.]MDB4733197.1 hypothetical protein [Planctomicrobium sp.]
MGCGGSPGLPDGETGTVSGKLSLDGETVPAGSAVIFTPESGGLPAIGEVGSGGSFSLKMKGGSDILVGTYKVSVSAPVVEVDPAAAMEASVAGEDVGGEVAFPVKYLNPDASGETFTVKEGDNTFDLDMKTE